MSFIKKNCTIVVLVAIIVSSLAINALAVNEILDWGGLLYVDVLKKVVRGCAPMTEEAYLKTSSDIYDHYSFAEIGCFVCEVWEQEYSENPGKNPDSVSPAIEFSSSCWTGGAEHGCAGFDAEIIS